MILTSLIKNLFVPRLQNELRPYLFRKGFLIAVVIFILVLQLGLIVYTQVIMPRSSYLADVISSVLVQETNNYRVSKGENQLRPNKLLEDAARLKAEDMIARSYFSHAGPDGEKPWVWFDKVGYSYDYAGENLAVDFTDSIDVSEAWVHSPKHRDNLLSIDFTEVGIGIATGQYNGKQTTFVVQFFGTPATRVFALAPTKTASTVADSSDKDTEEVLIEEEIPVNTLAFVNTDGVVLGTSTKALSTSSIEGTTAQYDMSHAYKVIASSPNFSVRQIMLLVLVVMLAVLLIPIFVILKSNRIAGVDMKIREAFKLYKSSIVTVLVVVVLTGLFIFVNYLEFAHSVKVI